MGTDTRTRRTVLARCWRGSCFGIGFIICSSIIFVMMWILWCYVGLISIPTTEPQRRALVQYPVTTAKPNLTTPSINTTIAPQPRSQSTPLRGNSRGEAQIARKESSSASRTEDNTSKGDFNARERLATTATNTSSPILSKEVSSAESSGEAKRYDDSQYQPSVLVRAVPSSAAENRDDVTGSDRRSSEGDRTASGQRNYDTAEAGRRPSESSPPRNDDYGSDKTRLARPPAKDEYESDGRSRDYDKERPMARDYVDRDERPVVVRKDERRADGDRAYDRVPEDRDRTRLERDRDDNPRRRYDDIDDRDYPRSSSRRRVDGDDRYREPVRTIDDDRDKRTLSRDDRYSEPIDDKLRRDSYDRRPPPDSYRDKVRDSAEDRYRSPVDDRYDRDDRYRSVDDDYKRDRYKDEDKNRRRPVDDDYRRDTYRDDDRVRRREDGARPLDDERYRPRRDPEPTIRRDDLKTRGEAEPRRPIALIPRDEKALLTSNTEPRNRDDADRKIEGSRTYVGDDRRVDLPKSAIDDDRYRDRKDDRRRYDSSDSDYETRVRSPVDSDGYTYRDRPRTRDDPRYDDRSDDIDRKSSGPRYTSEETDRRRVEDRDRGRRPADDRLALDPVGRRDRDYKDSSRPVVDRLKPTYLADDRELPGNVRTKPEDVTLDQRSYSTSEDGYTRNRPRADAKLSYDRDDRESRYRSPTRELPETDYRDDKYETRSRDTYESRSKDRYDEDDYRSKGDYDRRDDRRYPRDEIRTGRVNPDDRVRDLILPSRTIPDDRPIRTSRDDIPSRSSYPADVRPSKVDDDYYARGESSYNRESETRRRESIDLGPDSRKPTQPNIREKRYQEDPCANGRGRGSDRNDCEYTSPSRVSDPLRPEKDISDRPLTAKEVIEADYRHREEPDRPVEAVYPVFDPRVNNMTSPELIRPNERRGTIVTSKKKKK